jgi:hypothetical protein
MIFSAFMLSGSSSMVMAETDVQKYLSTNEIRPGMRGYGLTTLNGNEIVRYPIRVLSVMGNRGGTIPRFKSILIKLDDDGEFPDDWVGFQNDMAGSPVYINNKLIGAVYSFSEWSRQEIAQVRPIEEMQLIAERHGNINKKENAFKRKTLLETAKESSNTASGVSVETSPFSNNNKNADNIRALLPGDAIAAVWAIGDYTRIEKGNVTEVTDGNEFYAFGKSIFGRVGLINAPLIRVDVLNTMKGFNRNFQIANPGLIVGTIQEDRISGVYGQLGEIPDLLDVEVIIHDVLYGKVHEAFTLVINDEKFYPQLVPEAVSHSIRKHLDVSWEGTIDLAFEVTFTVDSGAVKTWGARNIFYGDKITSLALNDLTKTLNTLSENDFGKVQIDKISVEVFWTPLRETARIESLEIVDCDGLWKKDERYVLKRGEEITLKVAIRPYKRELIKQEITIKIDDEFPKGDAVIQVRGGGSLLPKPNDISKEALKKIEENITGRTRILEPSPPKGLESLLSGMAFLTPSNRRIVELISTEKTPARGVERFNQTDNAEMDFVIYGFDSILVKIKD